MTDTVTRPRIVGIFAPAATLALLLWFVASLPASNLTAIQTTPRQPVLRFLLSDPVMHAATFTPLALLLAWGFERSGVRRMQYRKVGALALGYGLLIELYQWALPWRTFGLDDLLWNAVGVAAGLALAWLWFRIRGPSPSAAESPTR